MIYQIIYIYADIEPYKNINTCIFIYISSSTFSSNLCTFKSMLIFVRYIPPRVPPRDLPSPERMLYLTSRLREHMTKADTRAWLKALLMRPHDPSDRGRVFFAHRCCGFEAISDENNKTVI